MSACVIEKERWQERVRAEQVRCPISGSKLNTHTHTHTHTHVVYFESYLEEEASKNLSLSTFDNMQQQKKMFDLFEDMKLLCCCLYGFIATSNKKQKNAEKLPFNQLTHSRISDLESI